MLRFCLALNIILLNASQLGARERDETRYRDIRKAGYGLFWRNCELSDSVISNATDHQSKTSLNTIHEHAHIRYPRNK
ncbi:hypothetical protein POJ06DRAFT_256919 [Lipomyces tetrasporus]|uniref:Secreted protein n=1 Tax=Lipomyces tetrasporus TaxID=54092 RepID=A0AAD7QQA9_9ASCO|nr:uncharacterized protein POJ06DRAFT_256919 [Lipomyces tetrasporus]KAJ8099419.1 hypothetical protein POJ06DRAFT_256919 [Lipomyces tetrasporus]